MNKQVKQTEQFIYHMNALREQCKSGTNTKHVIPKDFLNNMDTMSPANDSLLDEGHAAVTAQLKDHHEGSQEFAKNQKKMWSKKLVT